MAARYWLAQLARAIVAFVIGGLISLDQAHTATAGTVYFAIFAILGGLIAAASGFTVDSGDRTLWLVQGIAGAVAGVVALVVHSTGLGGLLYSVSVWALITGAVELSAAWRARSREASARDRLLVGGVTVVLAIVYLVIPADHRLAVGLLGVYGVVVGVYLAIGAFSLKWATPAVRADEATESHA